MSTIQECQVCEGVEQVAVGDHLVTCTECLETPRMTKIEVATLRSCVGVLRKHGAVDANLYRRLIAALNTIDEVRAIAITGRRHARQHKVRASNLMSRARMDGTIRTCSAILRAIEGGGQ